MASTGKTIATGCGIGCLLLALVMGGLGTCAVVGIRNVKEKADDLKVVFKELESEYGDVGDYTPAADGHIDPARLEVFLAVRDSLLTGGARAERLMRTLDGADGAPAGRLAKVKAGLDLVPAIVTVIDAQVSALRDGGMGLGEYAYIYTLGYYVLLGEAPGAGPGFTLDRNSDDDDSTVRWSSDSDGDARDQRDRKVRETLNQAMRAILANQRAAAIAAGEDGAWTDALDAELERLNRDYERLPWQDGLPEAILVSLAPYRDRLAATWSEYLNALEMVNLQR
ncbi:MAG: hypothetical protein R3D98_16015 [Candidatus Krumholzibacteriia bacterium]